MLTAIKNIKGLGIFSDYTPAPGTKPFAAKNLIYGWNYSGKTTLSRVFSHIERGAWHPEITGYKFSIETDTGTVTEENSHSSGHIVRVFNSDFVAENLNFAGSSLRPILLLGPESEGAQKEIGRLDAMRKRVNQAIANQQKAAKKARDALSAAKTGAAAATKRAISLTEIYTATQLDKDIDQVNLRQADHKLSEAAIESDLKLARTSDQEALPPLPKMLPRTTLPEVWSKAQELLLQTPALANAVQYLTEHPEVERWVEHGLPLHEGKGTCEFCANPVSAQRLQALGEHFSKEQAAFKAKVESLLAQALEAKIAYQPRKALEFNAPFRQSFEQASSDVERAVQKHNNVVDELCSEIRAKLSAVFAPRQLAALDESVPQDWIQAGSSLDQIIDAHNRIAEHFKVEKAKAIGRSKLHFAQEFIEKNRLDYQVRKQDRWKSRCQKLEAMGADIDTKKQELEATISRAQRGREMINRRIENLLGSDSVQIKVIEKDGEERFQLVRRNGSIARHLSEGEKTAIAFSFFLTKLQELQDFGNAIVYIDDPISSLDSNHIFQVTAIIKDVFFEQAEKTGEWRTRCKQVFFSTHNFEFFRLLHELKPKEEKRASHFLVRRVSPSTAVLENMPNSILRHSSEYHFLFSVLDSFNKAQNKSDFEVLMHIPNAVRRFVELYTYSKYPDGIDGSLDRRADRIFGGEKSKRILKVLHYFSHGNNIERIATNTDLMCDIEAAVKDLIDQLEKRDPEHLEALRAAL